jgi:hypothetical protein
MHPLKTHNTPHYFLTATATPTHNSKMAAPPALPSPQEAKSKATTMETTKPSTASSSPRCTMDYLSTKHSPSYTAAKSKLSSGELDECLSLIEGQLADVKSSLVAVDDDKVGNDELELHEALCPLYYLYGTTLLYLVEENESMMNNSGGDKVSFVIGLARACVMIDVEFVNVDLMLFILVDTVIFLSC